LTEIRKKIRIKSNKSEPRTVPALTCSVKMALSRGPVQLLPSNQTYLQPSIARIRIPTGFKTVEGMDESFANRYVMLAKTASLRNVAHMVTYKYESFVRFRTSHFRKV